MVELRVIFEDKISGLVLGAPVELNGLRIGSVQNMTGIVDQATFGDGRVRLDVVIGVQPARLGIQGAIDPEAVIDYLRERVQNGLRARLASASLLTGSLKIELLQIKRHRPC